MKRILRTNAQSWAGFLARWVLAITVFPHGAQKLLGWFNGLGFSSTLDVFTNILHIPMVVVLLVIIFEFFGALFMALGLGTRIAAAAISLNFIGVIFFDIIGNGFFMNWGGASGQGEGMEYFVLLFGLLIISLIYGGGKASIDAALAPGKPRD